MGPARMTQGAKSIGFQLTAYLRRPASTAAELGSNLWLCLHSALALHQAWSPTRSICFLHFAFDELDRRRCLGAPFLRAVIRVGVTWMWMWMWMAIFVFRRCCEDGLIRDRFWSNLCIVTRC